MSELYAKLGKLLQLERERRQLSLEEISEKLKISESNLGSIESGRADELPAELYYNLFAKSYSEFLGIDFTKTVEAIETDLQEQATTKAKNGTQKERDGEEYLDDEEAEPKEEPFFNKKIIGIGAAILTGFVLFIIVYQIFWGGSDSTAGLIDGEGTAEGHQSAIESQDADLANYNWDVPDYVPPDSIRLTLKAKDASWATVLADGDTVIYRNLNPGRIYQVTAKYRLLVSVGIPRLVDVELDGRAAYLASASSGRISRVEINQTNRDGFFDRPTQAAATTPSLPKPTPTTEIKTEPVDSASQDTTPPEGI